MTEKNTIQPVQIPDGAYFILGGNRLNSLDSRTTSTVDRAQALGEYRIHGI